MGKRILRVNSNGKGVRVLVGPKVKNRRRGSGEGTNRGRQSSQDRPEPIKRR